MKPITEEEIKRVEKILLPEDKTFGNDDSERVNVIKDIQNSCHVVACPGSGKTTVLLAKLLLLADRMPFENNQGICVLTHTNVAIDEIKKKAGTAGDKLFKYPNFFGTIQSFVDKFLAMPSYINENRKKIEFIDYDRYLTKIKSEYYSVISSNLRYGIEQKHKNIELDKFLGELIIDVKDNSFLKLGINGKRLNYKSNNSDSYKALIELKQNMNDKGYLAYQDAYYFSQKYLSKFTITLRKAFSQSFKYVFVDEMQDTDTHQLDVIEGLFNDTNTIIQYYGDPNQAIFDNQVKDKKVWIVPKKGAKNRYDISDSKRYGEPIANILNILKVEQGIDLSGNDDINTLKPILILFEKGKEKEVLNKFVELIESNKYQWEDVENPVYKAVGWVGTPKDDKEKLTIQSYWDRFDKKSNQKKQVYDNLKPYLRKQPDCNSSKIYYDNFINAFLRCLELAGIKYKGKTSLLNELDEKKKKHEVLSKIAVWGQEINSGKDIFHAVKKYLENDFDKIFEYEKDKLKVFLSEKEKSASYDKPIKDKSHIYEHEDIKIEVGTVHSVKGETHTATLYMETFYKKYETKKIIEFLTSEISNVNAIQKNSQKNEALKMLHVGFSRPTHLLCFAVCQDHLSDENLEKLQDNWDVDIL